LLWSPVRGREVVDIFKAPPAKIVEKIYTIVIRMCRAPMPPLATRRGANRAKMPVTEAAIMRI